MNDRIYIKQIRITDRGTIVEKEPIPLEQFFKEVSKFKNEIYKNLPAVALNFWDDEKIEFPSGKVWQEVYVDTETDVDRGLLDDIFSDDYNLVINSIVSEMTINGATYRQRHNDFYVRGRKPLKIIKKLINERRK